MTSDEIYDLIQYIAATPGKNDKIALLTAAISDADLQRVLWAAYDPLTTYGVRKRPVTIGEHGSKQFDEGTWQLIDALAARTLTGNAAITAVAGEMTALTKKSAELFWRILQGDMRAGFDAETCNKAKKGLIRTFPYMRCSLPKHIKKLDEFFKDGCTVQEKADGMYMNLDHAEDGEVRLSSRAGTQYPIGPFQDLVDAVRACITPGTQLHGEMLVVRDGEILPREEGNGILGHVEAGGDFDDEERPLYLAWDQIPLSAAVPKGRYTVPYKERLANLIRQLPAGDHDGVNSIRLIETKVVRSMKEALVFHRKKLAERKEGTIVKKLTAIWKDGTSLEQIKLKVKFQFEARVKGFNEGSGKNAGKISSLQCASECGAVEFSVSCRGDAMIDQVTANPQDWRDAIVTCEGNLIQEPGDSNPKHSIFLPVFVEKRTDKTTADDLARIREQFQAALEAA